MKKNLLYLVIGLLASCTRTLNVDPPAHTSRLSLFSLTVQDSQIKAAIGRSIPVLTPARPDDYRIANAQVTLYKNGTIAGPLLYDPATYSYTGTTKVEEGAVYRITATATGFEHIEAESHTPVGIPVKVESRKPFARISREGIEQDELTISFTDPGATADYYLLRLKNGYHTNITCVNSYATDIESPVSDDPFNTDQCLDGSKLLLNDTKFNGTTKKLVLYVNSTQLNNAVRGQPYVELLHISSQYYQYLKSINNYDNAHDNPFAEPVNLYTNIQKGYGIFTTYTSKVDSIP